MHVEQIRTVKTGILVQFVHAVKDFMKSVSRYNTRALRGSFWLILFLESTPPWPTPSRPGGIICYSNNFCDDEHACGANQDCANGETEAICTCSEGFHQVGMKP